MKTGKVSYNYKLVANHYYNPRISQFYATDPLAEKYPNFSPYTYTADNPVMLVDPDGRKTSPIYDTNGNFLGTDDKGLKGEPIIMNKYHFKQGMAHNEAKIYNLGQNFLSEKNYKKFITHFNKLPERPDYDGYLTFYDAIKWYNTGNGKPLFIDISKLDFKSSKLSSADFKNKNELMVNFFVLDTNKKALHRPARNQNLGAVFGTLTIKYLGNGKVDLVKNKNGLIDIFDFRNQRFEKIADYLYPGEGVSFKIFGYGGPGEIWKK